MNENLLIQFNAYLESSYKYVEFIGDGEYMFRSDNHYHLFKYEEGDTFNLYGKLNLFDDWNYIESLELI